MDSANSSEVLAAVHACGQAWARNDLAVLEPMLRADYLHTDVAGNTQDRSHWLAYVSDRRDRGLTSTVDFADVRVRVFGEVAVATGENLIGTPLDPSQTLRIRFTQAWVRDPRAGWQRAAFQATPILAR